MPTPTTHLGLNDWAGGDQFNWSQLNTNFTLIDDSPGILICTSTTRPGMGGGPAAWGTNQTGMKIVETDTLLTWTWNGTAFLRQAPLGYLARSTRTSNLGTTSQWAEPGTGTFASLLTATVTISAGGRRVMLVAEVPEVTNPNGLSYFAIESGSTLLTSWPVWTTQETVMGDSSYPGSKGDYITFDTPSAGSVTYNLVFAASVLLGGTSTAVGSSNRPIGLTVLEV